MNRRVSLMLGIGILAGLLLVSRTTAYPISPAPLWNLVQRSELVVLAEVVEISEEAGPQPDAKDYPSMVAYLDGNGSARLRVIETWKGEPVRLVDVLFPRFLICPAPPRYIEGKVVVAFLTKGEEGWETTSLSYGTLYPRKDDVPDFRSMVRDAVALQRSSAVKNSDRLDWHVKAASLPGTRWHGLYELAPESDELHYNYEQEPARLGLRAAREGTKLELSLGQIRRIAHGFKQVPPTDRTLPMILAVLAGYHDVEVDRAAVSAVEGVLAAGDVPWWIKGALYEALVRFGDTDPASRLSPLGDSLSEIVPERAREIWEKAKKDLGIPNVPPAEPRPEEVWGVGSNTPS